MSSELDHVLNLRDNPFQIVYDGLWSLVESNEQLMAVVRPGNRVKFDGNEGMQRNTTLGDYPELVLLPEGGLANLYATSSSSEISKTYAWMVNTDSFNITKNYNYLIWQLYISMACYCSMIGDFKWNNKPFIKALRIPEESTELTAEGVEDRGVRGWSTILRVELDMYFTTKDLMKYCSPCNQGEI